MVIGQRRAAVLATGVAALLSFAVLAGCAADSAEDSASRGGDNSGEVERLLPEVDTGGEAGGAQVPGRHVIYTGAITIEVADVDGAADAASRLAQRYEGFVGGDHRMVDGHSAEARLVLRIPSERFTEAVAALADLGEEQLREIDTEDVTTAVVDVATRVASAQASVERTRELLDRAQSITDVVAIEAELAKREADLASLQARQRTLADLTTLSTVEVRLLNPAAAEEALQPGFLTGLAAGWQGFTLSLAILLTVLGFLLPWLVALAIPGSALAWWFARRRAARRIPRQPAQPAQQPAH